MDWLSTSDTFESRSIGLQLMLKKNNHTAPKRYKSVTTFYKWKRKKLKRLGVFFLQWNWMEYDQEQRLEHMEEHG